MCKGNQDIFQKYVRMLNVVLISIEVLLAHIRAQFYTRLKC
jgi:hypothetical protein